MFSLWLIWVDFDIQPGVIQCAPFPGFFDTIPAFHSLLPPLTLDSKGWCKPPFDTTQGWVESYPFLSAPAQEKSWGTSFSWEARPCVEEAVWTRSSSTRKEGGQGGGMLGKYQVTALPHLPHHTTATFPLSRLLCMGWESLLLSDIKVGK